MARCGEGRDIVGLPLPGGPPRLKTQRLGHRRVVVVVHIPQMDVQKDRLGGISRPVVEAVTVSADGQHVTLRAPSPGAEKGERA